MGRNKGDAGSRVTFISRASPLFRADALKRSGDLTLAYVEGLSAVARGRIESPTLRMAPRRIDVARTAAECDLAVLNRGHGGTCQMLSAGKPILFVPLMTSDAVTRVGAGESAPRRKGQRWQGVAKLDGMLEDPHCSRAARRFADRYAALDPARQAEELPAGETHSQSPRGTSHAAELTAV